MRFFWTFRSLPELNHLTEEQKQQVIRSAVTGKVRRALAFKVVAAGVFFGGISAAVFANWAAVAMGAVAAVLFGAFIGALTFQVEMTDIRLTLRRFLFEHFRGEKLPVCFRCGYNLTGNPTDRCPECGANVRVPQKHPSRGSD